MVARYIPSSSSSSGKSGPKHAHAASFKKGKDDKRKNNGRKKGSKNRLPTSVKEAIVEAMNIAGGKQGMVGYFLQVIRDYNLGCRLAEKLIPTQIVGPNDGPIQTLNIPIELMRKMNPTELSVLNTTLMKLGGLDVPDSNHPQPLMIEHQPLGDGDAYAREIGIVKKSKNNGAVKH